MKTAMQANVVHTMSDQPVISVSGMALAGLEFGGCRGKGKGRTKGINQRRSRRRTLWMPVWSASAQ